MIKRFLCLFLLFSVLNFMSLPVLAYSQSRNVNYVIDTVFVTHLDVNKASKGQVMQFITNEDYKAGNYIIPKGTIFSGQVRHFKKARWGYRRAKVRIVINKMILPNEEVYGVKGHTNRHVLKGSAIKNVGKGIVSFPVALVVGATGTCVIIVEAVSIAGILLIGPTSYVFGETMGKLTHGINYKRKEGDDIKLKIESITNNPIETVRPKEL